MRHRFYHNINTGALVFLVNSFLTKQGNGSFLNIQPLTPKLSFCFLFKYLNQGWFKFPYKFLFLSVIFLNMFSFSPYSNLKGGDYSLHKKKKFRIKKKKRRMRFVPTLKIGLSAFKNFNMVGLPRITSLLTPNLLVTPPYAGFVGICLSSFNLTLPRLEKRFILNSSFFFPRLKKKEVSFLNIKKRRPRPQVSQAKASMIQSDSLKGGRGLFLFKSKLSKQNPRFGFSQGSSQERRFFKLKKYKRRSLFRAKGRLFRGVARRKTKQFIFNSKTNFNFNQRPQLMFEPGIKKPHFNKFFTSSQTNPLKFTAKELKLRVHPNKPEPRSMLFPFKQPTVRFRPGFKKYWRAHRLVFWVNYINHNPTRQLNLTKYVQKLRSVSYFSLFKLFSMSLGFLAWQSSFFKNKSFTYYWALTLRGSFLVNGLASFNPYKQCLKGDIISLRHYVKPNLMPTNDGFKSLFSWAVQPNKIKFITNKENWPQVFSFCEVDHLTLSSVVINEPQLFILKALKAVLIPPHPTLKMYNWKYLT